MRFLRSCLVGLIGLQYAVGVAGCRASVEPRNPSYFLHAAMGVKVEVRIDERDPQKAREAAIAAFARIDALDALWSDWKPDSEVSRFNQSVVDGPIEVSAETGAALAIAMEVAYATEGRFDPTIAPLVALWRQSRAARALPSQAAVDAARRRVNYRQLECNGVSALIKLEPSLAIDLGGIGKGLAAAEAVAILATKGCPRCLVAVAGDLAAGEAPEGCDSWKVDIAWPDGTTEEIALLRQSASTSGDAEQFVAIDGVKYAHIIDPTTGLGATRTQQVTVIGARTSSEELAVASITDPHSFIANGGRVDAFATALAISGDHPIQLPTGFRVIRETARK